MSNASSVSRRGVLVLTVTVAVLAGAVITGWRAGWPPLLFGNSSGRPAGARFLVRQMGAATDTPYRLARNLYVNDPSAWSALPANSRSALLARLSQAERNFRDLHEGVFPIPATLTAQVEHEHGTPAMVLAARSGSARGVATSDYGATAFGDAPLQFGTASYAGYTGYQNLLGWVPCATTKPQTGPVVKICGGQAMAAAEQDPQAGMTGEIVTVAGLAAAQASQPVAATYTNHATHDEKLTVTGSAASITMTMSATAFGAGCDRSVMKYAAPSSGTLSPALPNPPVFSLGTCLSTFHEEVPIGSFGIALSKGMSQAVNIVNYLTDAYSTVSDKAMLANAPALKACASGQMLSDVAVFIKDFGGVGLPGCNPTPLPTWTGTVPAGATVTFTATPATQAITLGVGAQATGLFTFVHLHIAESPTTTGSGPAVSQAPVDWNNKTYALTCDNIVQTPVNVAFSASKATARGPGIGPYDHWLMSIDQVSHGVLPSLGDVTAVLFSCSPQASNFTVQELRVYRTADGTEIGRIPELPYNGGFLPGLYQAGSVTIANSRISADATFYGPGDSHASGPSVPGHLSWSWNGQQFVTDASSVTACPDSAQLVSAWNSASTALRQSWVGPQVTGFTGISCWHGWVVSVPTATSPGNGYVVFSQTGSLHLITVTELQQQFRSEVCSAPDAPPGWRNPPLISCS